jgi:hypothetical protein
MSLKHGLALSMLGTLIAACACSRAKQPVEATDPTEQQAPPPSSDAAVIQRLRDLRQDVRDAAAIEIRKLIVEDAAAAGDPGEAHWKGKLAQVKPGMSEAAFLAATGAKSEGTNSSGRSSSTNFRLDDYWTVVAHFDLPDSLRKVEPLTRHARSLWVSPPKNFTGRWITYYVNGVVDNDIQYRNGTYERFATYYDNGQLVHVEVYVNGKVEGPQISYHPDGSKAYEGQSSKGKSVGRWVHWYANGKKQSESTYVDDQQDGPSMRWREDGTKWSRIDYSKGKETGQAAWDEQGKLLYANGTAENAGP